MYQAAQPNRIKEIRFMNPLFLVGIMLLLSFPSCDKEKTCEQWHEGDACQRMTSKFAGVWYGSGGCSGLPFESSASVAITEATRVDQINIQKGNGTFNALLYESGLSYQIPRQGTNTSGVEVEGLGYINGVYFT